jgi:N-acetyl-gamma-glutamyl-phosphate reductase
MQQKIKAGIIGGAGYTGGELIRLLLNHSQAEIVFAHSKSSAGKPLYAVHSDLLGETELHFSNEVKEDIDVLFLCLGHGEAKAFLASNPVPASVKIIDLSQDFRLTADNPEFIYGLPELNHDKISSGKYHIANPGCFATCIQLALLPLAQTGLLNNEIHVNATTGSTGAGQALSGTSHFSWRNNNMSAYKSFEHQHLAEIGQSIQQLQPNFQPEISFIPNRGSFARGIFATVYMQSDLNETDAIALFKKYYSNSPFVFISDTNIDLKQVVNTNKCLLHIAKHGSKLMIMSIIDNLLKGASGQAVQNMNLLFGIEENTGLKLKPSAF